MMPLLSYYRAAAAVTLVKCLPARLPYARYFLPSVTNHHILTMRVYPRARTYTYYYYYIVRVYYYNIFGVRQNHTTGGALTRLRRRSHISHVHTRARSAV